MNDFKTYVLDEFFCPEIDVYEEEYLIKFQYNKTDFYYRDDLFRAMEFMRKKCPSDFWTCIHVYIHTHDLFTGEECSIANETVDIPYRNVSIFTIQKLFGIVSEDLENPTRMDTVRVDYFKLVMKRTKPQRKRRKGLSNSIRAQVLDRDDYTCQMCGISREDGARLEVDHIIPVSKGGTNDINNLQTLCSRCNRGKFNNMNFKATRDKLEGVD